MDFEARLVLVLSGDGGEAYGGERTCAYAVIMQALKDAYDLSKNRVESFDKHAQEALPVTSAVLLIQEMAELKSYLESTLFQVYCISLGFAPQVVQTYILEVSSGLRELEVKRLLKVQSTFARGKVQRAKRA